MASITLPKPLLSIPRLPSRSPPPPPNKLSIPLARSFSLSLHHSLLLHSRVSSTLFPRRKFAARAESEPESGGGEEAVEEVVEEGAVAVLEAKEKEEGEGEEVKEPPRKPRIKLGEIMGILNKRAVEASEKVRPVPDIRTGDIVEIKLEVPENKRRLSVYKGIVMSKQNAGIHSTIRVRRVIAGVGVEIVFPLHSPNIKELKVLNHRKVRRARLYYLRDKLPRLSTFK